eukprot:CAMPEP_0169412126 /NCGR_PEP_ID=MMETSP1017-20121227/60659_1 /TAXON_ID=342587 /ORGANISM="Karlodinium micrum, Strain CCMP2283" /LENGTH=1042 /DNA_ID=CAMNT_0009519459 /DNA_START=44 /DNA_END=3173 /DNA_ORIENTATION=-
MVGSTKTKGNFAYVPKKRDIIPPDFFSDLSQQVEYLLADDASVPGSKSPMQETGDMISPLARSSPGRNTMVGMARERAKAYGKDSDPWGVGTQASLAKSVASSAGQRAPGQQRDQAELQDTIRPSADSTLGRDKGKQEKVEVDESGPSVPGEQLDVTLAPASNNAGVLSEGFLDKPIDDKSEDQLRAFFRQQTKDVMQDTVKSSMTFEEMQGAPTSPTSHGKPDASTTLRISAQDPDSPSFNDTVPAGKMKETATMQSPFKYIFESGSRFTPVHAADHNEGIERLRQYLVMKYGSMRRAWLRLEDASVDVTGLGFRHDSDHHVEGMLQYPEFVHAIKYLIPNWAEVTGVGQLSKLFKATKREHDQDEVMKKRSPIFVPISQMPLHHHHEARLADAFAPSSEAHRDENRSTATTEVDTVGLATGRASIVQGSLVPVDEPVVMHFYDENAQSWAVTTNEKQESDAESWISSDAHSSEQELDLHHIKLRLRAAGLSQNINWRKLFHHYDHKHMGEIDWFEFRSLIRADVQLTPDILSEEDLKRLFYSVDVVKEALGDSIFYDQFLEWLEPPPTQEELAELKHEIKTTKRHQRGHRFHKSPLLRNLEVERRHEAENHHDHMSCNPCTKMCPICRKIVLLSGWAPHKYACQRKARQRLEKDHQELEYLKKWNFIPKITAKGKRTKGTKPEDLHVSEREKDRFPIRDKRNQAHYDEWQEIQNKELTFQPKLNDQTRSIFRMVHQDGKEWHDRLHTGTPLHKLVGKVERKRNAKEVTKPRITVRGIQHGIERGTSNIFHRLHHGPPGVSTQPDPDANVEGEEAVEKLTAKLEKSAKPVGIGEASWAKVKAVQAMASLQALSKKAAQGDVAGKSPLPSPSPTSTGFPMAGSPGSDVFSSTPTTGTPMTLSARSAMTALLGQARSPRPEPGGTMGASGGVAALSGRLRASIFEKGGGSTMSTTAGTPLTATMPSPLESPAESNYSPLGRTLPPAEEGAEEDDDSENYNNGQEAEEEDDAGTVVTANPKLMSLLHRCDMMRNMVVKKREQAS